jgi:cyclic pyranopterin phosphate synthase
METPRTSRPSEGESRFSMVDVGEKPETSRRALARGEIRMSAEAFTRVMGRNLSKGDALLLSEMAAIQAAKKTSEWIPLCHPLLLDRVKVSCAGDAGTNSVIITAEVLGKGKTGFEMEALTAVSAGLLCIHDLVKSIDPCAEIGSISLVEKEGGKSGLWVNPTFSAKDSARTMHTPDLIGVECAILTISDRVSAGLAEDRSGVAIREFLASRGAKCGEFRVLPDEKETIVESLREFAGNGRIELCFLTGGTGLGPRDLTPEALAAACDRIVPGIGEKLRAEGARFTSRSWLSRSTAGLMGKMLIIALPGSLSAVQEGLQILESLLPHALHIARGGDHEHGK